MMCAIWRGALELYIINTACAINNLPNRLWNIETKLGLEEITFKNISSLLRVATYCRYLYAINEFPVTTPRVLNDLQTIGKRARCAVDSLSNHSQIASVIRLLRF